MTNKKVKNVPKLKKEAILLLVIGIVMFATSLSAFLALYRPWVPWVKFVCSEKDGTYIKVPQSTTRIYRYEMDGVWYEKTLYGIGGAHRDTVGSRDMEQNTIYVNKDNPTDVKRGALGSPAIIVIVCMFMVVGLYFIVWLCWIYVKQLKTYE